MLAGWGDDAVMMQLPYVVMLSCITSDAVME